MKSPILIHYIVFGVVTIARTILSSRRHKQMSLLMSRTCTSIFLSAHWCQVLKRSLLFSHCIKNPVIGVDIVADQRLKIPRRRPFRLIRDPAIEHRCKRCPNLPIYKLWEKDALMEHLIKKWVSILVHQSRDFEQTAGTISSNSQRMLTGKPPLWLRLPQHQCLPQMLKLMPNTFKHYSSSVRGLYFLFTI